MTTTNRITDRPAITAGATIEAKDIRVDDEIRLYGARVTVLSVHRADDVVCATVDRDGNTVAVKLPAYRLVEHIGYAR